MPLTLHQISKRSSQNGRSNKQLTGKDSFSIMSIENVMTKPLELNNEVEDHIDGKNASTDDLRQSLQLAKESSLNQRALSPSPFKQKAEVVIQTQETTQEPKQSGFSMFFSNLISVFTSEQQVQSKQELVEQLQTQQAELNRVIQAYMKQSRQLQSKFKHFKVDVQKTFKQVKGTIIST